MTTQYVLPHEMQQQIVYVSDQVQPIASGLAMQGMGMLPPLDADDEASKKNAWTKEEDDRLCELVGHYGPKKWSIIAEQLCTERVGKQCRERWHNHLSPTVRKDVWTDEEDKLIVEMVKTLGTKWSQIVKLLPGRTDNAIKNRWNSAMRKSLRKQQKTSVPPSSAGLEQAGEGAQMVQLSLPMVQAHLPPFGGASGYTVTGVQLGSCCPGHPQPQQLPVGLVHGSALALDGHGHALGKRRECEHAVCALELLMPSGSAVQMALEIAGSAGIAEGDKQRLLRELVLSSPDHAPPGRAQADGPAARQTAAMLAAGGGGWAQEGGGACSGSEGCSSDEEGEEEEDEDGEEGDGDEDFHRNAAAWAFAPKPLPLPLLLPLPLPLVPLLPLRTAAAAPQSARCSQPEAVAAGSAAEPGRAAPGCPAPAGQGRGRPQPSSGAQQGPAAQGDDEAPGSQQQQRQQPCGEALPRPPLPLPAHR